MKKGCCLVLALIFVLATIIPVSAIELNMKTNVPLDKVWTVKFNHGLKADTVNTQNIYIKDSKGQKLEVFTNLSKNDDKELFIVPKVNYKSGETYFVHITTGVKANNGKYLKEAVQMKFTTTSVNTPPTVIKEIEDQVAKAGEVVTVDLSKIFEDKDGDTLVYAVTTGEVFGSIYRYTVEDLSGPLKVTIGASDGNEIVYETFSIIINKQIDFEDNSIENAVREAINKPSGFLYADDVKNIETLSLSKKEIIGLKGMQYLVGLKELKLAFNDVKDVSPLSSLINLTYLDLKGNDIVNIGPLGGLTNLENLQLNHNEIIDITAIQNLTKLKELDLSYNQIENVEPLSKFKDLVLEIVQNPIKDYNPIKHLID